VLGTVIALALASCAPYQGSYYEPEPAHYDVYETGSVSSSSGHHHSLFGHLFGHGGLGEIGHLGGFDILRGHGGHGGDDHHHHH